MEDMKVMTPEEVRTLMSLAEDVRDGRIDLPAEIKDINRRIKEATHNAVQFLALLRQVDMSLVNEVVRLKLEKDRLYAEWAASETP